MLQRIPDLCGLALLVAATGCIAPQDEPQPGPPEGEFGHSETSKAECEAKKGTYARRGMLGSYTCAVPYPDAGKACTKPSDCEGQCRVESPQDEFGKCQANSNPFGCYSYINEEDQVVAICVD
ncbi:hypothetical protein [Parerythrobacter aestuarii]|uniref:hypothetical protein n=1 Tax=Parerythrobacter aestuarii TaxID=3020909 RepID=UPI0024DE50F5|nr:hypothetical protein [Parerythrobacter aestuarii]